ncbi:MAG: signal peptidase I [Bacteroides sp.]|jgi:signal peptidase I|uniref:signal peptidase I n=1 Tax=Bacteroides sp. TaxID=29523 RepID=UPI0025BC0259|nr:signal peptidase I [Bacteroides sp.]MBS6237793.1 signal peptidase I [Bacteroides sp.]
MNVYSNIRMENNNFGKKKKRVLWVIDKFLNLFLIAFGIVVIWVLLQVTTIATFRIPSDSMEPTLLAGDNILVNKWVMGGRIFNIWDAIDGKEVKISRLPALGKIKRNDVLVFNFPYPARWDSIGLNLMSYYVKRCVALPGDTFEIKKAHYRVRGCETSLGNVESQDALMRMAANGTEKDYGIVMSGYPYNGLVNWDIINFGPLYLPARGDDIEMNPKHVALYRNAIEWEQNKKLLLRGDTVLLNDSVIRNYRFKENYYFMTGDKVMNSQDSRYWGLLPEPFIVGKAVRVWKSVDRGTDKIRWKRIFRKIK